MSYRDFGDHGRAPSPLTNFSSSSGSSSGATGQPLLASVNGHKRSCSLGGAPPAPGLRHERPTGFPPGSGLTTSRSTKSLYMPSDVLGHGSQCGSKRGSKNSNWGFTLPSKSKSMKSPLPMQSLAMFEAVSRGLRECIRVAEDDISNLKLNIDSLSLESAQGKLYELEKQMKSAERYLKRVEFQLAKLDELFDQYDLQQKLREGMRSMAYAYVLSPGKERNTALNNVRCGFRECSDCMCAIEHELEQMMGTLTMQMKGIQGFSRLVPGDVFEISIKHGVQKWKNKGRVLKSSNQAWDNDQVTFKVLLNDVLVIKALEVKSLGKSSVLGTKFCDTADLFSAHPQIMTVNLNASGSLKLNLIVTWNPLHYANDDVGHAPSISVNSSTRSSPAVSRTFISSPHGGHSPSTPTSNNIDFVSHLSSTNIKSAHNYNSIERQSSNETDRQLKSELPDINRLSLNKHIEPHDDGLKMRPISPLSNASVSTTASSLRGSGSQLDVLTVPTTDGASLQEVLYDLISSMEDVQGQYPELQGLETTVLQLEDFLKNKKDRKRRMSLASSISISVENALGCFDFLESEEDTESNGRLTPDSMCLEKISEQNIDQGFASIKSQEANKSPEHDGISAQLAFLNYEQVEMALISHLTYCKILIQNLGSIGPLKCQELTAINKLKNESVIMDRLMKLVKQTKRDKRSVCGTKELKETDLQVMWEQCTESGRPLCITADMLSWKLQQTIDNILPAHQHSLSSKVVEMLLARIMDHRTHEKESIVTVFQFQSYFSRHRPFKDHILYVANEVTLLELIDTTDVRKLQNSVAQLSRHVLPSLDVIQRLALHLTVNGKEKEFIAYYLEDLSQNEAWREEISEKLVLNLESLDETTRLASCITLQYFQPYDYMDQLGYIAQTDPSNDVRQAATTTLLTLGDFGQQALETNYIGADSGCDTVTSL